MEYKTEAQLYAWGIRVCSVVLYLGSFKTDRDVKEGIEASIVSLILVIVH